MPFQAVGRRSLQQWCALRRGRQGTRVGDPCVRTAGRSAGDRTSARWCSSALFATGVSRRSTTILVPSSTTGWCGLAAWGSHAAPTSSSTSLGPPSLPRGSRRVDTGAAPLEEGRGGESDGVSRTVVLPFTFGIRIVGGGVLQGEC